MKTLTFKTIFERDKNLNKKKVLKKRKISEKKFCLIHFGCLFYQKLFLVAASFKKEEKNFNSC
jgi:hypothetical protein